MVSFTDSKIRATFTVHFVVNSVRFKYFPETFTAQKAEKKARTIIDSMINSTAVEYCPVAVI